MNWKKTIDLRLWKRIDFLIFFIVVPAILTLVYLLPVSIKDSFVLYWANPTPLSIFMSNYVHGGLVSNNGFGLEHLVFNIILYLLALFIIFFFVEKSRKRFGIASAFLFLVLPVISSLFSLWLLNEETMQGFSAIVYGFWGYLIWSIMEHISKKKPVNSISYVLIIFFAIIALLILIMPETTLSGPKINMLAHRIGFIFGIILASLKERKCII